MPDRIVRAGIVSSDRVAKLSWPAEVFYRRLMSVADDYGRFDGRPAVLRAAMYPLHLERVREADITTWIGECRDAVLVRLYSCSKGKPFVEILDFGQRIQAKSKWPDPVVNGDSPKSTVKNGESPPYSDSKSKTKSDAHTAPSASSIPSAMAKDGFPEHWQKWREYRAEMGEPLTSFTSRELFLKCERWGPKKSVAIIQKAIEMSWKNLRDDHEMTYGPGGKAPAPPPKPSKPDKPPEWAGQLKTVWQLVDKFKNPDPVQRLQIVAAIRALPREAWSVITGEDYNLLNGFLKEKA